MKRKPLFLLTSLAVLAFALPSQAIEQRTFKNADKTKSFDATLTGYDAKKQTVTVVFASGKKKSFPLHVLSQEDKDYVLAQQDLLTISKSVRLSFKELKAKSSGDGIDTSYAIEVRNNGKQAIEDISLKYTLYYSQGDLNKGGTVDKTSSGTLTTGKLYDSDTMTVETASVSIVRKSKPASGGG